MAKRKNKRSHDFTLGDLAEMMKFLLSKQRRGFLRVVEITEKPDEVGGETDPLAEIVIRVDLPNPKKASTGKRLLPVQRYKDFFESWTVQKEFILWLGKLFAEGIPRTGRNAKYRKMFERLRVGRPGALPPTFYLRHEKEILLAQLRAIRALFINRGQKLATESGRKELLEEIPKARPIWLHLLKSGQLDPAELMVGNLHDVVNYVLSLQYGTGEEAVRSRIYRNG